MPASAPTSYVQDTVASGTFTISGDTGLLTGYGGAATIRAALVVTAAAGTTPSLTVVIEDTLDGTNWFQVGAFAAKTAAATEAINVTTPFADRIRVRWTITGTTPSFTFTVILATQGQLA